MTSIHDFTSVDFKSYQHWKCSVVLHALCPIVPVLLLSCVTACSVLPVLCRVRLGHSCSVRSYGIFLKRIIRLIRTVQLWSRIILNRKVIIALSCCQSSSIQGIDCITDPSFPLTTVSSAAIRSTDSMPNVIDPGRSWSSSSPPFCCCSLNNALLHGFRITCP